MMSRFSTGLSVLLLVLAGLLGGCGEDGAPNARRQLRETHIPHLKEIVREDIAQHRVGIRKAADILARGFVADIDADTRERQMRQVLKSFSQYPGGIAELASSAKTFVAAVGRDGVIIARDADEDLMKGKDYGERYPLIHRALEEGVAGYELVEFPSRIEGEPGDWVMLFVAPSRVNGEVVGAAITGIPLWRLAQRLSRQMRVELAAEVESGLVLWVYVAKGDRLFYNDTPPELDEVLPDAQVRHDGLDRSPGGFTGELLLYTRWYGYGIIPMPSIGEDVTMLVVRADPPD